MDLLSILPTFVEVLLPGAASLRVVRMLRLLRVFRVLKLVGFLREAQILKDALRASQRKIVVFLSAVLVPSPCSGPWCTWWKMRMLASRASLGACIGPSSRSRRWGTETSHPKRFGSDHCLADDDPWLRHHGCADRHCWRRLSPARRADTNTQACPGCSAGPRRRRCVLQALRTRTLRGRSPRERACRSRVGVYFGPQTGAKRPSPES